MFKFLKKKWQCHKVEELRNRILSPVIPVFLNSGEPDEIECFRDNNCVLILPYKYHRCRHQYFPPEELVWVRELLNVSVTWRDRRVWSSNSASGRLHPASYVQFLFFNCTPEEASLSQLIISSGEIIHYQNIKDELGI